MKLKDKVANAKAGARTAKFEIGTIYQGVVESTTIRQCTNQETGDPDFWPIKPGQEVADPKEQAVIIISVDGLDEGPDDRGRPDDGRRAIYIKCWGQRWKALLEAISKAGTDSVYEGTVFAAKRISDSKEPPKRKTYKPEQRYLFKVEAPKAAPPVIFDQDEEEEITLPPATVKTTKKSAAEALAAAGLSPDDTF